MQARIPKSLGSWVLPVITIVVTFVIVSILTATQPEPPTKESKEKEWLVNTEKISINAHRPELELLGRIESPYATNLSASISADVLSVPVREGQHVKAGALLIQLEDKEAALAVKQRQADVTDLKAQIRSEKNRYKSDMQALESEKALLAITEKAVKRQAKLNESNLVAQERYETAQSQNAQQALSLINRELSIADHPNRLAQLRSKLLRAQTALEDAQLDLNRTAINAPYDGVITRVDVAPGDRVNVGQSLAALYDHQNIEIRSQIPDRQVSNISTALAKGEPIKGSAAQYGNTIDFELSRLSGQANPGAGGIDAFFSPLNNAGELVLNGTIKLRAQLPPIANTVAVPLSAIYGTNRLYLIEKGRLKLANVEIVGKVFTANGQDRAIIKSQDVKNGDIFITTQLPNAITGLNVKARD